MEGITHPDSLKEEKEGTRSREVQSTTSGKVTELVVSQPLKSLMKAT